MWRSADYPLSGFIVEPEFTGDHLLSPSRATNFSTVQSMMPPSSAPEGIVLRPLRTGEIIDAAMKIATRNVKQLFPLVAPIVFPVQLLLAFLSVQLGKEFDLASVSSATTPEQQQEALRSLGDRLQDRAPYVIGIGAAVVIGSLVLQTIATAALTSFIGEGLIGRKPNRGAAWRLAIRRAPIVVLATLLMSLFVGVVAVLCVLPGIIIGSTSFTIVGGIVAMVLLIWLVIRFQVQGPVIVLERYGPIKGLRRSFALVKGRWWAMLGLLIVSSIISGIASAVVSGIVSAILNAAGGDNNAFRFLWSAIGGTLAQALIAPFTAAVLVLAYIDLRVRNEAFDLDLLARSMTDLNDGNNPPGDLSALR